MCFLYLLQLALVSSLHLNERSADLQSNKFMPDVLGGTQFAKEEHDGHWCTSRHYTFSGAWSGGGCYSMLSMLGLLKSIYYQTYSGLSSENMPMTIAGCNSGGCWAVGLQISYWFAQAFVKTPEENVDDYLPPLPEGVVNPKYEKDYEKMVKMIKDNLPEWYLNVAYKQKIFVTGTEQEGGGPLMVLAENCPAGQIKGTCALGEYCLDRMLMGACHGVEEFRMSIQTMGCTFDVLVDGDDDGSKYANLFNTTTITRAGVIENSAGNRMSIAAINTHWAFDCISGEGCNSLKDDGGDLLSAFGMNSVCIAGFDTPQKRTNRAKTSKVISDTTGFLVNAFWALLYEGAKDGSHTWSQDQTNTYGARRRSMYGTENGWLACIHDGVMKTDIPEIVEDSIKNLKFPDKKPKFFGDKLHIQGCDDVYTPPVYQMPAPLPGGDPKSFTNQMIFGTPYEILSLIIEELSYVDYLEDVYALSIFDYMLSVFFVEESLVAMVSTDKAVGAWNRELHKYVVEMSTDIALLNDVFKAKAEMSHYEVEPYETYQYFGSSVSCKYEVGFLASEVEMIGWTVSKIYRYGKASAIPWVRTLAKVGNAGTAILTILYIQYSVVLNCAWFVYLIQYQTIKGQLAWPFGSLSKAFLKKVARHNPAMFEIDATHNKTGSHAHHHAPIMMLQAMTLQDRRNTLQSDFEPDAPIPGVNMPSFTSMMSPGSGAPLGTFEYSMDGAAIENNAVSETVYMMDLKPFYLRPTTLVMFVTGEVTPNTEPNLALALAHFIETSSYGDQFVGAHGPFKKILPLFSPLFSLCPAGKMTVKSKYYMFSWRPEERETHFGVCSYSMMISTNSLGPYSGATVEETIAMALLDKYEEDGGGVTCLTPYAQATLAGMLYFDGVAVQKNSYFLIAGGWFVSIWATLMNSNIRTKQYISIVYSEGTYLFNRYYETFPWLKTQNSLAFNSVEPTDAFAVMTYSSYKGYMLMCAMQIKIRSSHTYSDGGVEMTHYSAGYFYSWANAIKYPTLNELGKLSMEDQLGTGLDDSFYDESQHNLVKVDVPSTVEGTAEGVPSTDTTIVPDSCMVCATYVETCKPFLEVAGVAAKELQGGTDWGDMTPSSLGGERASKHLTYCEAYTNLERTAPPPYFNQPLIAPFLKFATKVVQSTSLSLGTAWAECAMMKLDLCSIHQVKLDIENSLLNPLWMGVDTLKATLYAMATTGDREAEPMAANLHLGDTTVTFTNADSSGGHVFCCTSFDLKILDIPGFKRETDKVKDTYDYVTNGKKWKSRTAIFGRLELLKMVKTPLNFDGASLVKGASVCAKKERFLCYPDALKIALDSAGWKLPMKCPTNEDKYYCWGKGATEFSKRLSGARMAMDANGEEMAYVFVAGDHNKNDPSSWWHEDPQRISKAEMILCCGVKIEI